MKRIFFFSVLVVIGSLMVQAQDVGIFKNMADIGEPNAFGFASFENGEYTLEGTGDNLGNEDFDDEVFLLYNEMSGSFAIEAFPEFVDAGEGGLMVRATLDDDSPHVSLMVDSQSRNFPQIRTIKGGGTIRDGDPEPAEAVKMRLERLGNSVHIYTIDETGAQTYLQTEVPLLGETVLAGLAATGGTTDDISLFFFREVKIEEFPLNVIRSIPGDTLTPGATLTGIKVTAKVRDGQTSDATIQEVLPDGSQVSNIQVSGGQFVDNGDGTIDWTLTGLSGEATLTYDLTLGDDDTSALWRGTFNDGVHRESYIGADSILPKTFSFTPKGPFDVDPNFPTLMQVEWGTPTDRAMNEDFGFFFDPRTSNGIALVAIDEPNNESLIQFTLNIPKDGTYYLFGNARDEDGNSDSFHVNMDDLPEGTDASRWNLNETSKFFEPQYVSRSDPGEDPRPFELTAGEHVFNLMSREDSASIDYLAVTTSPDLDLDNLNLDARAVAFRTISDDFLDEGETSASVEVSLFIKDGVSDSAILTEQPPAGFPVSNVKASAGNLTQNADGSFTLDVTGVTGQDVTLTYEVSAPADIGNFAVAGNFNGSLVVGNDDPIEMTGLLAVAGKPIAPSGKTAFFFGNVEANDIGDKMIVSNLRTAFGLEVQLFDDGNSPGFEMPPTLDGADMAFVSGTVGSGNIRDMNYHLNSEVPIVSNESFLADDFAFQPGTQGGAGDITEVEIVDNGHPITEGLDVGPLQVYRNPHGAGGLNDPPQGVRVLAQPVGDPTVALLYVLEKDGTANGQTTPGIRIHYFAGGGGYADLTSAGLRLFNQAVAYVLGVEPPTGIDDFMLY